MRFRKGVFTIEDWFGPFEGLTPDQTWNGWACPCFEHHIACQMVDAWEQATFGNDMFKARYDEKRDQFCFYTESDGEWGCFGAQIIDMQGRQMTVYAIGAHCWIWEEIPSA